MEIKVIVYNKFTQDYEQMYVELICGQIHGLPYYCYLTLPSINDIIVAAQRERQLNDKGHYTNALLHHVDEILAYTE